MNDGMYLLLLIVALLGVIYAGYRYKPSSIHEGIENMDKSTLNGIAGNAESFASTIKTESLRLQDMLLVPKYRTNYEDAIINLDEYVSASMLNTALTINPDKPTDALEQLVKLNTVKTALNNVMKYIDSK